MNSARSFLILLLVLFAGLASWYAAITPYRSAGVLLFQRGAEAADFGAPDERQHVNYVQGLRSGKGIPVFNPKDPALYESYQSHQPPLFYVLAAPFYGEDGRPIRYLNVLIGVATLIGLYRLGCAATGKVEIGLACSAVGLLPMSLALHGAVSNDPLLFCLTTWSVVMMLEAKTDRQHLLVGLMVGLALLTKSSAMALLPVLILYSYKFMPKDVNPTLRWAPFGVALLVAAPWLVRNTILYGDPLGLRVFSEAFVGTAQAKDMIAVLGAGTYWGQMVAWWTSRSFVGVFGYMDVFLPTKLYLYSFCALFLMVCGWLLAARTGEKDQVSKPAKWLLGTLALVVFALFMRFNSQYFQAQARYLYPALPAIALLIGGGATGFSRKFGWAALAALLVGLNLYILNGLPEEFHLRSDTYEGPRGPTPWMQAR